MAWRTLRRLLEAAFKKTEKSKPFNQQRKPFALSWAWEHTLCLCYCSFKNKFFSVLPPTLSHCSTFSAFPLECVRRNWKFAGRCCVSSSVLRCKMWSLISGQQHTHSPPLGRAPLSLSLPPCSSGRHLPCQELPSTSMSSRPDGAPNCPLTGLASLQWLP